MGTGFAIGRDIAVASFDKLQLIANLEGRLSTTKPRYYERHHVAMLVAIEPSFGLPFAIRLPGRRFDVAILFSET